MPHDQDVGLAGAAAAGRHRQVDRVGAGIERRFVGKHTHARRFMRVKVDEGVGRQHLAGLANRFVDLGGNGRSRSVLEADRIKGNLGVKNFLQRRRVERGIVRADASWRQLHQRDANLVLEPGVDDALAAVNQVVDIIERIEVSNRGHAVLLEQIGMQLDDVARLRIEADDVHAAGKRLQIGVRTGGLPKRIHHVERIFVAIEIQRLESRAAARLEPAECRRHAPLRPPAGNPW